MNRETEERIVAMYFDNKDFEKNAKTTIDTLGQLKNQMDMTEAAKGLNVFEKFGKNLRMDQINEGAKRLKNTFTGIGDVLKKSFDLKSGPLGNIETAFQSLSGYITKFIGFDLAGKIVNSVESVLRGLTIQPISAGWNQYESKMDSVKTIMSSTGESIEVVESHLQNLTEYANKTIYSLSDMTSNLGKFTNNGVKLKDATLAMQGIANATADAGQGAQAASMAMYNISQAIGVGKMTTIDWKSIENANIATTRLKDSFMEVAAANGQLRKEFSETDKKYHYFITRDSKGKEIKDRNKWTEVTTSNFRETLSKDWLTSEVMQRTLQFYSGQQIDPDTLKAWGITDPEVIEKLSKIGEEALNAATQVRTFSKMMDALKEATQSGWADTFELIFGDMQEGTNLWTKMNEFFDPILSGSAEARNKILEDWRNFGTRLEIYYDSEGRHERRIGEGGRDILIATFFEVMETAKEFASVLTGAFKDVFGEMTGEKLYNATVKLREFVAGIKEWLGSADDSESRLGKLKRGLTGFFSIVKTVVNFVKIGFNLISRLAKPALDFLITAFGKVGDFFTGLGDLNPVEVIEKLGEGLKSAWEKIKKFFTPKDMYDERGFKLNKQEIPAVTWLKNVWEKLKGLVREWAYDNGFGTVYDTVSGWWKTISDTLNAGKEKVAKIWEDVKDWFETSGIANFLTNTWNWITGLFRKDSNGDVDSRGYPHTAVQQTSPIERFLTDIWDGLKSTWDSIVKWPMWSGISTFLSSTWTWITSQFKPRRLSDENGHELTNQDPPIVRWLKGIWETVSNFWNNEIMTRARPIWTAISTFGSSTWTWITSQFKPTHLSDSEGHELSNQDPPVVRWLKGIWETISNFWNNDILGTARPIWVAISTFGSNTWQWITSQFKPTHLSDSEGHELSNQDPPVVRWLKGIWESISNFWNNDILGTARPIWTAIATFGSNTWQWITSQFKPTRLSDENGHELTNQDPPIVRWLKGIWEGVSNFWNNEIMTRARPIWTAISTFGSNTWQWITSQFKPTRLSDENGHELKNQDPPVVKWLKSIWDGVTKAWDEIVSWKGWEPVGKFLGDTWNWIQGLFTGSEESTGGASAETVKMVEENTADAEKTSKALQDGKGFFQTIVETVGDFIAKVVGAINGVIIPPEISAFFTAVGDVLKGIMNIATGYLQHLGNLLNGKGDLFWNIFIVSLPLLITAILQFFEKSRIKKLAEIEYTGQSLGQQFLEIAAGLMLLSTAVAIMTTIDTGKLLWAGGVVAVLGGVVAAIIAALSKLTAAKTEQEKVKSSERIINNLVDNLSKIGMVATAMALLPAIIRTIGDVKKELNGANIGEDVFNTLIGLLAAVAGIGVTMALIQKIAPKGIDPIATVKTVISIMGTTALVIGGLLGAGALIDLIDEKGIDNIVSGINKFGEVLEALSGAIVGLFTGGKKKIDESNQQQMTHNLEWLNSTLATTQTDNLYRIADLAGMLKKINDDADGLKGDNLREMAALMDTMGPALQRFVANVASVTQAEGARQQIEDTLAVANMLGSLGNGVSSITQAFMFFSQLDELTKLYGNEWIDHAIEDVSDIYAKLAAKLGEAVQKGIGDGTEGAEITFNAVPIVDAIVIALGKGRDRIATAVREMVQEALNRAGSTNQTYTVNTNATVDGETADVVNGLLNLSGESGFSLNLSELEEQLFGKDGQGGLLGSINSFTDQIPSIGDIFDSKGWMDFKDENGNEIDITGTIQQKLTDLSDSLSKTDPLKVTITPVFDMQNFSPESLQSALDAYLMQHPLSAFTSFGNNSMSLDFQSLSAELGMAEIKEKLDAILLAIGTADGNNTLAISGLSGDIVGVSDAVGNMKMYLDTGILVAQIAPYVDVELGKRARIAERTGVVYMNTK